MSEVLVDTAVIPLFGLGTRMAPFTSGVPKFMAPVTHGNESRPNIDYTLYECLGAGVENIVFVVGPGDEDQLRKYLGPIDKEVARIYEIAGKHTELKLEVARRAVFSEVEIVYIDQTGDKYGTAVALNAVRGALKGVEQFAVMGGDDFIWHPDGISELALAIDTLRSSDAQHAIMGKLVSRKEASHYGILQVDDAGLLQAIDEKPPLLRVPEKPLANVSRYILNGALIWPLLDEELSKPREDGHPEYYVTDVLNAAVADGQRFQTHRVRGVYLDAGSPQGILRASKFLSAQVKRDGSTLS